MKQTIIHFCLMIFSITILVTNSYAKNTNGTFNVLVIHSAEVEPYISLVNGFQNILPEDHPKYSFNHIYLDNREKLLNRYFQNQDFHKFDVAVAVGTIALRAIRDQKVIEPDFPVLFGAVSDPIGEKVIQSFNEPNEGRYTGATFSIDIRDRLREMRKIFPEVKNIGIIFSTMPQSLSYKGWLVEALKEPEFSDLRLYFRRVGTLNYKHGPEMMVHGAVEHFENLKEDVDLFLSPNDQMGIHPFFAQMAMRVTNKPVFGVGRDDVLATNAAVASAYPKIFETGERLAEYLESLRKGKDIKNLVPFRPDYNVIINEETLQNFK